MSSDEQSAFRERLARDSEFAAAFKLHELLAAGIRDHARSELKSYIKEKGEIHYWGGNIWPRSMTYAAAAVFVLFTGLYLVLRNYTTPVLEKEIAVQTESHEPESAITDTVMQAPEEAVVEQETPITHAPILADQDAEETVSGSFDKEELKDAKIGESDDAMISEDVAVKYNVLSEKMLSDTILSAPVLLALNTEVPASADYEYSRNQMSGVSKSSKSPATASNREQSEALKKQKTVLQDTAVSNAETKSLWKLEEAKTLVIEYWYSPVNFKGYRYNNNTIRLYGIDKSSCRMFVYNNEVYMRHDGKVYLLSLCPLACVFHIETNTEIINLILRQN